MLAAEGVERIADLDPVEAVMLAEARILAGDDGAKEIGRDLADRPPALPPRFALEGADQHQRRPRRRHEAIDENAEEDEAEHEKEEAGEEAKRAAQQAAPRATPAIVAGPIPHRRIEASAEQKGKGVQRRAVRKFPLPL